MITGDDLKDGKLIPFSETEARVDIIFLLLLSLSCLFDLVIMWSLWKQKTIPLDTQFIMSLSVADALFAVQGIVFQSIHGNLQTTYGYASLDYNIFTNYYQYSHLWRMGDWIFRLSIKFSNYGLFFCCFRLFGCGLDNPAILGSHPSISVKSKASLYHHIDDLDFTCDCVWSRVWS